MFDISEELMKKELEVISKTGLYRDEEEFIKEAVNTLLAARKDLRVSIAWNYIKRERFHWVNPVRLRL